ncbi:hypothetical protein [uncultured Maribacter sp.]|uniref:hypothetical protein n=1 Tax=uncultured Maribacter sp. TaxID=431308 RepID=UPI0026180241|nr:hypothetical protein [uncultured Maribacter sp.]
MLGKLKVAQYNEDYQTLEYAYGNYLVSTNNFKSSYNIYKKISDKTKFKEGQEIEYFLAKLNMKYLHNLVMEDESLADSFEIKQEARNIDLNKILYEEIEYSISDDVRNYLLKIKDEKLLISTKSKVDELVNKIIDLKIYCENQTTEFQSTDYIQELANCYNKLQIHLNKNWIIYNVYHEFRLLSAQVFKGFIKSYLTKEYGLTSFNSYFLTQFILCVNYQEFQKILSEVETIKLDEASEHEIVERISNLFESYTERGIFPHPYKNKLLEESLIDFQFKDYYKTIITNTFTLLSKIEITSNSFNSLSNIIIDFISIEDVLPWYSIKEFSKYLYKKGNRFSSENLNKVLKIAIERDLPDNNKYDDLIRVISKTIHKFHPDDKIKNKQLIKRAIGNVSLTYKWKNISHLLLITDEACSKILNKELEEVLDENWEFSLYDHLIRKKLYNYKNKEYFKKYVSEIINQKEIGFTGKFKNGKPIFKGFMFYNFVILLNILNFDREENILNEFTNISEFEKWLLRPKKYDYSNFDTKWIIASQNAYILNNLRGIDDLTKVIEAELKNKFNPVIAKTFYNNLL